MNTNAESQGFQTPEASTVAIYLAQSLQSSAAIIPTELTLERSEHMHSWLAFGFCQAGDGWFNLGHLIWKTSF